MAPLGTGPARLFTVTGSPVNLAARLREHAPVGGVLVGEESRRAARDVAVYVAQVPLDVKGFDRPVTAWAPCAVASAPGRPLSRAPFVGRERERSLLRTTWTAVRQAEDPRVVTVLGPPWVGRAAVAWDVACPTAARHPTTPWPAAPFARRHPRRRPARRGERTSGCLVGPVGSMAGRPGGTTRPNRMHGRPGRPSTRSRPRSREATGRS